MPSPVLQACKVGQCDWCADSSRIIIYWRIYWTAEYLLTQPPALRQGAAWWVCGRCAPQLRHDARIRRMTRTSWRGEEVDRP